MSITISGTTGLSGVDGSAGTPALQGSDPNTGISFGTDEVNINTGGSTRATVDSSGRVLVGTSSTSANTRVVIAGRSDGNPAGTLMMEGTSTSPANGDTFGLIRFSASGPTGSNAGAEIYTSRDGGTWTNNSSMPTRLVFSTTADGASSATERMRITSNGALCVGTTSAIGSARFVVESDPTTINPMSVSNTRTSAGGDYAILFYRANSIVGSIQTTLSATSYTTSSDYRLKENIVPLTGAANRVNQLQVHRFNFIADPDTTVDGFIAHEAQAVVPEAVTGTHDEVDADGNPIYQGIDQSKLVPLLTAALQEALAKIETLETRLTALEGGAAQ